MKKQQAEKQIEIRKDIRMEQNIEIKIIELYNLLDSIGWDISQAKTELDVIENKIQEKKENSIKDMDNLKRELKRDNLYTDEIEQFLENYMKYYNK